MQDSKGLAYNEKVRKECERLYLRGFPSRDLLTCMIDISQGKPVSSESPDSIFHISNALQVFFLHCFTYLCVHTYRRYS